MRQDRQLMTSEKPTGHPESSTTVLADENEKQSLKLTGACKQLPPENMDCCKRSEFSEKPSTCKVPRKTWKARIEELFIELREAIQEYLAPVLSGSVFYLLLWLLAAVFGNREDLPWEEHANEFFCHAAFGDAVPIFIGLAFVGLSFILSAHRVVRHLRTLLVNPAIDFAHHAALLGAGALIAFNARTHHFDIAFWHSHYVKYLLTVGAVLQGALMVQRLTDDALPNYPKVGYVYLCLGAFVVAVGGYYLVSDVSQVAQVNACQPAQR